MTTVEVGRCNVVCIGVCSHGHVCPVNLLCKHSDVMWQMMAEGCHRTQIVVLRCMGHSHRAALPTATSAARSGTLTYHCLISATQLLSATMATASLPQQRVRPFATSCMLPRCPTRVAILTRNKITQVCAATAGDKSQAPTLPTSGIVTASAAAALGAWSFAAQRAIADELPAAAASTVSSIGDIVVDTSASGKGYGLEDFLVTLLFGTVVLLLAVVTGGVSHARNGAALGGYRCHTEYVRLLFAWKGHTHAHVLSPTASRISCGCSCVPHCNLPCGHAPCTPDPASPYVRPAPCQLPVNQLPPPPSPHAPIRMLPRLSPYCTHGNHQDGMWRCCCWCLCCRLRTST